MLGCLVGIIPNFASANSHIESPKIDPQLEQLVQIIKSRSNTPLPVKPTHPGASTQDEFYVDAIDDMLMALYSGEPQAISEAIHVFEAAYSDDGALQLAYIKSLFKEYAHGLEADLSSDDLLIIVNKYVETGNWFEKFFALEISSYLHSNALEQHTALQKSQQALSLIPENSENDVYARYAKVQITGTIAQLHNFQGNSSLALEVSLDYLKLTEDDPDAETDIDLLNNLIYSYGVSRDHAAQLFLSEFLLELEKTRSSSIPGLSEMRIASVMNANSRFNEGLDFAVQSINKTEHPTVLRNSTIYKAVALAGLGRTVEARETGKSANIDFAKEHMLQIEDNTGVLYLAFILAQQEDPDYAVQLVNRQHDVVARNLLKNNTRDTTAMLADLENNRGRQAEREAAAKREAELQAQTIDRQRKLNRTLIFLLFLLGGAALAAMLFARFRSRIVRALEIKTEEAASAEKLKTDFLGMISHELRTPLNGIIGISDFLAHYHEDPDIRKKTGIVLKSGQELLSVVESLTDMARLDAGQLMLVPHDANLSVSLAAAPEPWAAPAQEKGLAFTHFVDPAITQHFIDEERLMQCLNILLSNAIRFTKAGRVHLHITADQSNENETITGLTAIVADTGQGMSELVQSRLFTPFMQADASLKRNHMGTGLSLAIAYALAEKMNGSLSVFSREGRGSEFKLQIPLVPAKSEKTHSTGLMAIGGGSFGKPADAIFDAEHQETSESFTVDAPAGGSEKSAQGDIIDLMQPRAGQPALHDNTRGAAQTPETQGRHVLVIDNNESHRNAVVTALKSQGYRCREAKDGFAALDILDKTNFDLIILDIHMTPIDGAEILRRIRNSARAYANMPVVVITAKDAVGLTAECMTAGANLFLAKPVREDDLLQTLDFLQLDEQFSVQNTARA